MYVRRFITPFSLPIYAFGLAIVLGTLALVHPASLAEGRSLSWTDALFTATSATCVTGLIVVDTGTHFSWFGQTVILALIQLGGLGIMTYSSMVFYLWRRRVTLRDRFAVGSLMSDPSLNLGLFLRNLFFWVISFEAAGAVALFAFDPQGFSPFSAVFHSVSAFCNAGFSLQASSLNAWRGNLPINLVFMILIVSGGIGFSVLVEISSAIAHKLGKPQAAATSRARLSWYARIIIGTSAWLVVAGFGVILLGEYLGGSFQGMGIGEASLAALFQSVTCRTAGFNTVDTGAMTNMAITFMMVLMFIGGSPGSTAGGIKTSTARVLAAFFTSRMRGRDQIVIGKYAADYATHNKVFTLLAFATSILTVAVLLLTMSEGSMPHPESEGLFLEILFEAVSAFGTVGLSLGLTPELSLFGKYVIIGLMFVGRLGPILLLSHLQELHERPHYRWPDEALLIG
jgi:trk system potassium uptake protein TrkH